MEQLGGREVDRERAGEGPEIVVLDGLGLVAAVFREHDVVGPVFVREVSLDVDEAGEVGPNGFG